MRTIVRLAPLVLVAALLPLVRPAAAIPTGSLPGYCLLAATVNVWQGAGVGPGTTTQWETDANWSTGQHPNRPGAVRDVCIPSGGRPVIRAGQEGHVRTLDVDSGALLRVDTGGKLFTFGAQSADEDSVIRFGGRVEVVGGTYGGTARLHVLGSLVLRANAASASTLLTRDCTYDTTPGAGYPGEEGCDPPSTPAAGPTGVVEVDDRGLLAFSGGGVNVGDGYHVVVRGLMKVQAGAYVAADHGTRVELRPHRTAAAGTGTLRFEGDGGYLEGKITADTGVSTLSELVNQGLILKSAGTGRTLVAAAYSQPSPGTVTVSTGTLLLPDGPVAPARVGGGSAYGTGQCESAVTTSCPTVLTDAPGYRQSAEFRVPSADSTGSRVTVSELDAPSTAADLGLPYELHATDLQATVDDPAVILMRFDASVLNGRRAGGVSIYRQSGTAPYVAVRNCTSLGRPPAGEVSCVDRRVDVGSRNLDGGDVLMVIRTVRTSRWVAR